MRYYLRHEGGVDAVGPYTVEEILKYLQRGEWDVHSYATTDIGEPFQDVLNSRSSDWIRIGQIPGVDTAVEAPSASVTQQSYDVPSRERIWAPLIAWSIALLIPFLMFPLSISGFFLFPLGLKELSNLSATDDLVILLGWSIYILLNALLLIFHKKELYYTIYVVLCLLLLCNAYGCARMNPTMSDLR